jgi:hypothetical protein
MALLSLSGRPSFSQQRNKTEISPPGSELPKVVQTGVYSNSNYSYTIEIPAGLAGILDAPPSPNHGILIKLSKKAENPERSMAIFAYYDAAELGSAEKIAQQDMSRFNETSKTAVIQSETKMTLQGLEGVHTVANYDETQSRKHMVRESIILLRHSPKHEVGIEYDLRLESTAEDYPRDAEQFRAFFRSFRLLPLTN